MCICIDKYVCVHNKMYIPAYQWFWTSAVGVGQRSAWAPLSGGLGLPRNVVVGFGTKVLWKQRKQREISGVRCWLNHQNGNRMGIWGLMMGCIMDLKHGKLSLGLGPRHVSLPEAICQAHVDQLISGISPVMYIQYTIIYIYIYICIHMCIYMWYVFLIWHINQLLSETIRRVQENMRMTAIITSGQLKSSWVFWGWDVLATCLEVTLSRGSTR